jgi:hypothetical protein
MASVRPRDTASPSPTPVVLSVLPSRWKGANILSLSDSGTPGPQSITRSSIRPLRALAITSGDRRSWLTSRQQGRPHPVSLSDRPGRSCRRGGPGALLVATRDAVGEEAGHCPG